MVVLACRDISQLVLDHSEHLSHRIVNTTGELVLVVDCEPAAEHGSNIGLEDLGDRQLCERLVFQDIEVLFGLGAVSKVLRVVRLHGDLAEDILGVLGILRVQAHVIGRENIAVSLILETFHSFQIDHGFDNMQTLQNTVKISKKPNN